MGDPCIERSGLGNELNYVPTDKETLLADGLENVFVLGDATNLPSSKAGSVVHFQSEILFQNFLEHAEGREMRSRYDGHANCFIESGFGKGLLIDFNYQTEPLPGEYPSAGRWTFHVVGRKQRQSLWQAHVPMGLLESASPRCRNADWLSHVDGRKASLTMTTTIVLEDRVAGIESKLDLILEELSHLRRLRNEAEDLVSDLTIVAKDALREVYETPVLRWTCSRKSLANCFGLRFSMQGC